MIKVIEHYKRVVDFFHYVTIIQIILINFENISLRIYDHIRTTNSPSKEKGRGEEE